jgi:hypothetical protein
MTGRDLSGDPQSSFSETRVKVIPTVKSRPRYANFGQRPLYLGDAFAPAKLGNRIFAAQSGYDDPDLFFRGIFSACRTADIPHML